MAEPNTNNNKDDNWSFSWEDARVDDPGQPDEFENNLLREARERFRICIDWEAQARTNFEYDYKFANGDAHNKYQWDNDLVLKREGESRPCLTVNKVAQHNLLVINDSKQNKPGVRIRPVGSDASYDAAEINQEIIYHIEYISNAENIYDSAMTFQVEAGWGYWRLDTDYIDDKSFDQEIYIRRIKDPRSVYLDPNITEIDGSDAWFGFIFDDMPKDLFYAKHPEWIGVVGQNTSLGESVDDGWLGKNKIRVAEYFRKTQKKDKLVHWVNSHGEQILKKLSKLDDMEKLQYREIKKLKETRELFQFQERNILIDDVQWYKIAGDRLIDQGEWPGKYIPIIRLVGIETVIDGILDRKGHTRALIDPQRMYNWNAPLSLDTPLPTPDGWTTMGEVKEGDWLLDENGKPVLVIGKSQIHLNRKCYKINFDNDNHIIADSEHLWTVEERGKRKSQTWDWQTKTLTTEQLIAKKHFINVTKALDLPQIDLPIHPYVLGAWLGDGSTAVNIITSSLDDYNDISKIINSYGYNVGEPRIYSNSSAASLTIHGLRSELVDANVLNNKHIPSIYLRASQEQRELLLRGLMDTDGHFSSNNNQCIFINNNKLIIYGIVELLKTLGIKSKTSLVKGFKKKFPNGNYYITDDSYRVVFTVDPYIQVFNLKRKANKQTKIRNIHNRRTKRHNIVSIEEVSSVPVQCIGVKSNTHLFLAGKGMVPTHNSADVEYGALQTKAPWMAATGAIEGYVDMYEKANAINYAYLPFNAYDDEGRELPPPTRPAPPQASPAYVQRMQISINEMMMASGQFQSQMGENENAKSGVAINARQRQGDRATYHFLDNQAIAIRFTGKMILDLIPKIYDTKRIMRITTRDGTVMNIRIDPDAQQAMQQVPTEEKDKENKIKEIIFNPNVGNYDVQADTGPSYATRRMEAFNALTQIAAQNKDFMHIGGDLFFKVADFPEADVLAQRYRRAIPPAILGEGPDAQTEQLMHQASDQIEKLKMLVQQQSKELADKDREFKIKENELSLREKEATVRENRQDYDSETKRVVALGNAGPIITAEMVEPAIKQLLQGMIRNDPNYLENLFKIHNAPIGDNQEKDEGNQQLPTPEEPPVEGARKAQDNNWYIKQDEQYYKVE